MFQSWGHESPDVYTPQGLKAKLAALDSGEYGSVLRAKGIVPGADGAWLYFDTGRLCVIGAGLRQDKLAALFGGEG